MAVSLEKTPTFTFDDNITTINSPGTYTITGGLNCGTGISYSSTSTDWVIHTNPTNQELADKIDAIEERLKILNVDETLHEKYPALKEAYEHYKTIEALVKQRDE